MQLLSNVRLTDFGAQTQQFHVHILILLVVIVLRLYRGVARFLTFLEWHGPFKLFVFIFAATHGQSLSIVQLIRLVDFDALLALAKIRRVVNFEDV